MLTSAVILILGASSFVGAMATYALRARVEALEARVRRLEGNRD